MVIKWQLAVEGEIAHLITLPHVPKKTIDRFVDQIASDLRKKKTSKEKPNHPDSMNHVPISFFEERKANGDFRSDPGNLLEWYEIYLFVYWSPIISKLFFNSPSNLTNLTYTFMIFGVGFLARPLGGIFFGRLGDRIGRKKAMILSILMMILPTFVTGLLHLRTDWHFRSNHSGAHAFFTSFPRRRRIARGHLLPLRKLSPSHSKIPLQLGPVGYQVGILISTSSAFS